MDVFYIYTYSTAAWLSVQAVALMALPKLVVALVAKEGTPVTDVEIYLARLLAISLFTISIITLFFTGTIPVSSNSIPPVTSTTSTSTDPESPYTTPILVTTTLFHSLCTFYTYARYTQDGTSGYVLGAAGYGALASIGVWCLVFGTGPGRVSGRTGMDKRTSRWLSGKGSGREKLV